MPVKLRGGAVKDPVSDQNFRGLAKDGQELDNRLTNVEKEGLPPSGKAGGVLKGSYPNPEFAADMATQAELDNGLALKQDAATAATDVELAVETSAREDADQIEKEAREAADASEKSTRESKDNERVVGPASATSDDISVFSGTTGKLVKDGGKTIAQVLDRANHTGTQLASTVSDFDTQVRTSRLDQMAAPNTDLSVNSHKLTNVLDPTENLDAANKEYVDAAAAAAAAGLSLKNPVAYATAAAVTATAEAEKTLEGDCPLVVDGKTAPAVGLRLLLKNQASENRNGLYEVTKEECWEGEGSWEGEGEWEKGSKWLLTRTPDADTEAEVKQGMFILVTLGAANANTTWILTTENPVVIGTTAQTFAAFTAQPIGAAGGDFEGTYPNPSYKAGSIVNADVNASAAIAYSKLNLVLGILNGDIAATAEIAYSKLKLAASVKGTDLVEGTVEDKRLDSPIIRGRISSAGAVTLGSGFTSEKTATGKYKVTLNTELSTVGVMMATPANEAESVTSFIHVSSNGKKVFTIETRNTTNTLTDFGFNFWVIKS